MSTSAETPQYPRRFPRKDYIGRAVLFFGKDSEVSETIQVSEGGLLTYTKLRLAVGDALTVHFLVNDSYIRARAKILYVLPEAEEGRFKVGMCFNALFEEYRSVLREFTT